MPHLLSQCLCHLQTEKQEINFWRPLVAMELQRLSTSIYVFYHNHCHWQWQSTSHWEKLDSLTITIPTTHGCLEVGVRRTEGALQVSDSMSSSHSSQYLVTLVNTNPTKGLPAEGKARLIMCSEQWQCHWTPRVRNPKVKPPLNVLMAIVLKAYLIFSQTQLIMLRVHTDGNINEKILTSLH